ALNLLQGEILNSSVKMATVKQTPRLWFNESKAIVTVRRHFCLEYRNCQSPSKNLSSVVMGNLKEQEKLPDCRRSPMKLLNE
ncbi:hypothetical protein AVEN_26822-1, partial [Araneus ventricosus]